MAMVLAVTPVMVVFAGMLVPVMICPAPRPTVLDTPVRVLLALVMMPMGVLLIKTERVTEPDAVAGADTDRVNGAEEPTAVMVVPAGMPGPTMVWPTARLAMFDTAPMIVLPIAVVPVNCVAPTIAVMTPAGTPTPVMILPTAGVGRGRADR